MSLKHSMLKLEDITAARFFAYLKIVSMILTLA
jgi:hypothetical protein